MRPLGAARLKSSSDLEGQGDERPREGRQSITPGRRSSSVRLVPPPGGIWGNHFPARDLDGPACAPPWQRRPDLGDSALRARIDWSSGSRTRRSVRARDAVSLGPAGLMRDLVLVGRGCSADEGPFATLPDCVSVRVLPLCFGVAVDVHAGLWS
jgi:hypothetical protein